MVEQEERERGGCCGDERTDWMEGEQSEEPWRERRAQARAGKGSLTRVLACFMPA